MHKTVPVLTPL